MTARHSRWAQPPPARARAGANVSCVLVMLIGMVGVALMCVSGWKMLSALSPRAADGTPSGGLGVGVEFNEYPHWEGQERVNILILGIDQRGQEQGPWRTDTLIVLSVDPISQSAGMLSIPRDLWVEIPGYGMNRINTAYVLGESNRYPGGGAALAKKTVQFNLGEPIHYYVRLNFTAAEQLIDLIGGIDVYVEREIDDPLYPDAGYGYEPLYIPAGWQHMDGRLAVKYARTRHGSSDFERARRQQQVLLAIRDKVTRLDMLVQLAPRAGEIAPTLGNTVQSDLTLDQVLRLAHLGIEIDSNRIRTAVIDSTMTQNWTTPEGAQVLIPDRQRMAVLHGLIFSPPAQADDPATQIALEAAAVAVQNGTPVAGLASRCAEHLGQQGFRVINVSSAPRQDYASTLILVYTGKWATARALARALGVSDSAVTVGSSPQGAYDITVILGKDYQPPSP